MDHPVPPDDGAVYPLPALHPNENTLFVLDVIADIQVSTGSTVLMVIDVLQDEQLKRSSLVNLSFHSGHTHYRGHLPAFDVVVINLIYVDAQNMGNKKFVLQAEDAAQKKSLHDQVQVEVRLHAPPAP